MFLDIQLKQVLQNIKNGEIEVAEVAEPVAKTGHVLIASRCSLVSVGTEKMMLDFGRANWLDKARQQPDKVKMVLDKIKTDGFLPTLNSVKNKLDQPLALGYCNIGRIINVENGND